MTKRKGVTVLCAGLGAAFATAAAVGIGIENDKIETSFVDTPSSMTAGLALLILAAVTSSAAVAISIPLDKAVATAIFLGLAFVFSSTSFVYFMPPEVCINFFGFQHCLKTEEDVPFGWYNGMQIAAATNLLVAAALATSTAGRGACRHRSDAHPPLPTRLAPLTPVAPAGAPGGALATSTALAPPPSPPENAAAAPPPVAPITPTPPTLAIRP